MGESDALGLIRRASNSLPTSKFPISLSSPRTTGWNKLTNSQYLQALDHVNIPIYEDRICQHITRKKKNQYLNNKAFQQTARLQFTESRVRRGKAKSENRGLFNTLIILIILIVCLFWLYQCPSQSSWSMISIHPSKKRDD